MSASGLLRALGLSGLFLVGLFGSASPQSRDVVVEGPAARLSPRPEVFLQLGHTAVVAGVAISPDGGTLASASWDNTLKLWDIATGRLLRTLGGHSDTVSGLAFTPDGRTLASGAGSKITLWDVATGRGVRGLDAWGGGLAFSADGRILLAAAPRGLTLWDPTTGQKLREIDGLPVVTSVALAPDGKTFVSGGSGPSRSPGMDARSRPAAVA